MPQHMADEQKTRPEENEISGGLLHPQFTHPISREKYHKTHIPVMLLEDRLMIDVVNS